MKFIENEEPYENHTKWRKLRKSYKKPKTIENDENHGKWKKLQ